MKTTVYKLLMTKLFCYGFPESFSIFLLVVEVYGIIFQQDGAPPHFGAIVYAAMGEQFLAQ